MCLVNHYGRNKLCSNRRLFVQCHYSFELLEAKSLRDHSVAAIRVPVADGVESGTNTFSQICEEC